MPARHSRWRRIRVLANDAEKSATDPSGAQVANARRPPDLQTRPIPSQLSPAGEEPVSVVLSLGVWGQNGRAVNWHGTRSVSACS
jgi:hypothetical protein